MKNQYQIRKNGYGYSCGVLIPYFWSWHCGYFKTYQEALNELNKHIKDIKESEEKRKTEVVYEIEC